MVTLLEFLESNGTVLTAGVMALLALGCLAAAACRSPVHRQRVCEGTVLAAVAWVVLACVPMPRLGWSPVPAAAVSHVPAVSTPANEIALIPAELIAQPRAGATGTPLPAERVPPSAAPARGNGNVRRALAAAYLAGALICAAWLALGCLVLRRLIRRAVAAPPDVQGEADALTATGGRRVQVLVSPRVTGPLTCGIWRPVILLPSALLDERRERQLRQVLLHEAGHVRQRDGWGNWLFCLALPVLYVHPCYWWLRRSAELARELVVDDWAARADGKDAYVAELVALARSRVDAAVGMAIGTIGIVRRRSHFYRRMRMLLQRSEPLATGCSTRWRIGAAALTIAAVAGPAAFVGVRPAVAQERPPEQVAKEREATVEFKVSDAPVKVVDGNWVALQTARAPEEDARREELQAHLAKAQTEVQALKEKLRRLEAAEGKPAAPPPPRPAPPAVAPPPAQQADPGPRLSGAAPGSVGGVHLDLVNLANTIVDASGAVRLAKVKMESEAANRGAGRELAAAEANLVTAQKRLELLRGIARVALESAKQSYSTVKKRYEMGMEGNLSVEEAAGKVKMLELIVEGGA